MHEISKFEVEVRFLQNVTEEFDDLAAYWRFLSPTVPILTRLACVIMTLPHGNVEVERIFYIMPDLLTKKEK